MLKAAVSKTGEGASLPWVSNPTLLRKTFLGYEIIVVWVRRVGPSASPSGSNVTLPGRVIAASIWNSPALSSGPVQSHPRSAAGLSPARCRAPLSRRWRVVMADPSQESVGAALVQDDTEVADAGGPEVVVAGAVSTRWSWRPEAEG